MTWEHVRYAFAGMGALALLGFGPLAALVYWFATTYATQNWVIKQMEAQLATAREREKELREDMAAVSARQDRTESQLHEVSLANRDLKNSTDTLTKAVETLNRNMTWIFRRLANPGKAEGMDHDG